MNFELMERIAVAENIKPEYGSKCNSCGWCCLTEVCPIGVMFGGGSMIPCKHIVVENDKHLCGLIVNDIVSAEMIGSGEGCCAETQNERLSKIR